MGHLRNDGENRQLHILIQPNIGLNGEARHSIVAILNITLADEAIITLKTKSAYWHMRGPGYLDLRTLFSQQLYQLHKITDEIAERVRIMDGFAIGSFEEFLNAARLQELPGEVPGMIDLLADHEAFIRFLRIDARRCSEELEDDGTFALFVRFIRKHEKMAWSLRTYIESEMSPDQSQEEKVRSPLR